MIRKRNQAAQLKLRIPAGKVLVQLLPAEENSAGGILLPEKHRDRREEAGPRRAIVVALGAEGEYRRRRLREPTKHEESKGKVLAWNEGKLLGLKPHLVAEGQVVLIQRLWNTDKQEKQIAFLDGGKAGEELASSLGLLADEEYFVLDEYEEILAVIES